MTAFTLSRPKPTAADLRAMRVIELLAEEESWLDHYTQMGVAAPKTEERIHDLRAELKKLRGAS